MNNKILLTAALFTTSFAGFAQNSNKAFAITGDGNNDYIWMNIRQVDLGTGQVTKTLFERSKTTYVLTDAATKKNANPITNGNIFQSTDYPTGTYVAAAAYDGNSNKLFFTPMRSGELRWMDLNGKETAQFYTIHSAELGVNPNDEATNITRMVIGADGNGYAMSNDGNNFIMFTTGKKPVITNLGNIIDADNNNGTSIHNKCSSWGGDMIADAFGKLYVISANHNVFVIDPKTRVATYKGAITGLPAGYTTNAAAVNTDGDIVVASANRFDGYYKLKLADLAAVKIEGSDVKYNASDFANGNLLLQKEADAANRFSMENSKLPTTDLAIGDSKVYPNPVTNSSFNVLFDGKKEGKYSIVLTDLAGRTVLTKTVGISKGTQVEQVRLNANTAKGVYMVKVISESNEVVIKEKIVVQ
ncbi:MAG: T9SS type A sorting domain-containing protein [Bacteroidetes bacterium]|nr:T9SS type A sorting domain-containing protein [Bacteroidota bacterium]